MVPHSWYEGVGNSKWWNSNANVVSDHSLSFMNDVTKTIRKGDADTNLYIIASTMELISNSGYGSLIMDKSKHQNTKYVDHRTDACDLVNDPGFRKLAWLDQD